MKGKEAMKQLSISPAIYEYQTFKDFSEQFILSKDDMILTNEYIYEPFMAALGLPCQKLFQEKFGTGEPTDIMVQSILDEVNKMPVKRIVAIGGGTIIDIAKTLVFKGENDIYGIYDNIAAMNKEKGLVIVPTTCGTGSEVTNLSIINLTRLGTKKGLGSDLMYADQAVLIPEFLESLPYPVFAASSIDSLIHAIESFLNPKATEYTDLFASAAVKTILQGYRFVLENGKESWLNKGGEFLRASNYAGIAFSNSGCAAVHALSYALGGKYHVPHGESNYQFLMSVLNMYKKKAPGGKLERLEQLILNELPGSGSFSALSELLEGILHLKKMRDYGAVQEDIDIFAKSTVENQQRLLSGNYVSLDPDEIRSIYQERL
jgi:Alcohol dehydrogenase, class IV